MEKYKCTFENEYKGIYLTIKPNLKFNYVDISAFKDSEHQVSVCLRDEQIDELIKELQKFRNRR